MNIRKSEVINLFIFVLIILPLPSIGGRVGLTSYVNDVFLFFDRYPGPKQHSLGKTGISIEGDIYSALNNPATLKKSNYLDFTMSTSTHDLLFKGGTDINYIGASFGLWKDFRSGVSIYNINATKTNFFDEYNNYVGTYKSTTNYYTFSIANSWNSKFSYGINVHYLEKMVNTGHKITTASSYLFTIGGLLSLELIKNKSYTISQGIGIGISNPLNERIRDIFTTSDIQLPSIFRIGLSEKLTFWNDQNYKNNERFSLTLQLEYQNLLNSRHRNSYKCGLECLIHEILSIRMGYYTEDISYYYGNDYNESKKEFTYGIGIILPFDKESNSVLPDGIKLDYSGPGQSLNSQRNYFNYSDIEILSIELLWMF